LGEGKWRNKRQSQLVQNSCAMANQVGSVAEPSVVSLIFSSSGAVIAVCTTIVVCVVVLFLLSRRYPLIALQYKDSKIELRREGQSSPAKAPYIGATANPADADNSVDPANLARNISTPQDEKRPVDLSDLLDAINKHDKDAINKVFDHFKDNPPFPDDFPYDVDVWRHLELLRAGFSESRVDLERIERERIGSADASMALAKYYLDIHAPQQAIPHMEVVFKRAKLDLDMAHAVLIKAGYTREVDGYESACNFLISESYRVTSEAGLSLIYERLGDYFRDNKKELQAIASYERALKCDVHNKDARFQLAYLYGEIDALSTMAIRHYRILLQQDRRYWSAQNNLGVQYQKLEMHWHKIEAWKEALDRGEEFPLSNLMFAYLETGFIEPAKLLHKSAPEYVRSGTRVAAAYSKLQRMPGEEREKLDSYLQSAEEIWREFTKDDVDLAVSEESWLGEWQQLGGVSKLKVSRSGEFIEVEEEAGSIIRKGYLRAGRIAIGTISEEDKSRDKRIGLLALGGYSSGAGHFIIFSTKKALKVLHVSERGLRSAREYTRNPM
jgi:tetratricopeptide (TPR) repeat protein